MLLRSFAMKILKKGNFQSLAYDVGRSNTTRLLASFLRVPSGELKLKLFSPGNIMGVSVASAIAGNWYAANNATGEPSCKLTGEEAIKTSHDERFKSSKLADEEAMKEETLKVRHQQWMKECNRTYKDEAEKARRFEIFKSNVEFIEKFNAEEEEKYGPRKNVIGTNGFADWTRGEYLALLTPFEDIDVDRVV
ncbi:hypothetical protein E2562_027731 [Oryza meyeriana var. granulata]|uniref:Cathepsin propeptide inhibitor domain-containing protein n=1 Tax=Oryza meyeriana var. granulata TaxID=110450 RepID=A0A6G1EQI3_9ORYZ|nr:hypothetical protein E2562_027731 [Oryza meyeriana var. granulata]KAF0926876.1 hypothetical protein E2562_027731 [Oryza meyeriana var. granulata]KAF0926877.1 hypothetical protein E2562_027731 [Oryza meyeriana var. granulata]